MVFLRPFVKWTLIIHSLCVYQAGRGIEGYLKKTYPTPYQVVEKAADDSEYYDLLQFICRLPANSCLGRCGEEITEKFQEITCACDVLCQVYGDCCPFFQEDCPSTAAQFQKDYSHLSKLGGECFEKGQRLISNCEYEDGSEVAQVSPFSPAITDLDTMLHYKNAEVLRCATSTKGPINNSRILRWDVEYRDSTIRSGDEIKSYIFNPNTWDNRLQKKIAYMHPDGYRSRRCNLNIPITVECFQNGTDKVLLFTNTAMNMAQICKIIMEQHPVSASWDQHTTPSFHTTPGFLQNASSIATNCHHVRQIAKSRDLGGFDPLRATTQLKNNEFTLTLENTVFTLKALQCNRDPESEYGCSLVAECLSGNVYYAGTCKESKYVYLQLQAYKEERYLFFLLRNYMLSYEGLDLVEEWSEESEIGDDNVLSQSLYRVVGNRWETTLSDRPLDLGIYLQVQLIETFRLLHVQNMFYCISEDASHFDRNRSFSMHDSDNLAKCETLPFEQDAGKWSSAAHWLTRAESVKSCIISIIISVYLDLASF